MAGGSVARRRWTTEEDTTLRQAVLGYDPSNISRSAWTDIAHRVGNERSPKDCRKRWFYTLDPVLRKGRWSKEEDAILRLAYQEYGPRWHKIAKRIRGRTDEQVAKRWKDVLAPDLKLEAPWTEEEDALLLELYEKHGPKWTLMSDFVEGRNGIACRNRFRRFKLSKDVPSCSEASATMNQTGQETSHVPYEDIQGGDTPTETPFINALFPFIHSAQSHQLLELEEGSSQNHTAIETFNPGQADGFAFHFVHDDNIISGNPRTTTSMPPPGAATIGSNPLDFDLAHDDAGLAIARDDNAAAERATHPALSLLADYTYPSPFDLSTWLEGLQSKQTPKVVNSNSIEQSTLEVSAPTPFSQWLDRMLLEAPAGPSAPPAGPSHQHPTDDIPLAIADRNRTEKASSAGSPCVDKPIDSVWDLIPALESGREHLTLSTSLIRRLIEDARR